MKLATTTGDFYGYTHSQIKALEHIRAAGFKYADYNFGSEYRERTGAFSEDYKRHLGEVAEAAEKIGIKLIQAHSPMGKPLVDDGGVFIADTIRCVEACGYWGIPNIVVHSGYITGLSKEETFLKKPQALPRCCTVWVPRTMCLQEHLQKAIVCCITAPSARLIMKTT